MSDRNLLLRNFAGLALSCFASTASAEFFDGKMLLDLLSAQDRIDRKRASNVDYANSARANGYVLGVIDAVFTVDLCPNETITAGEITVLVKQYLSANPEKWTLSGDRAVIEALKPSMPCPKRP